VEQTQRLTLTEFAPPVFGIKAKLQHGIDKRDAEFAPPVFGIKAKRLKLPDQFRFEFAPPVFGIKAKPDAP